MLRDKLAKVAEVCVESLFNENTNNKIIEIITKQNAEAKNCEQLFASIS